MTRPWRDSLDIGRVTRRRHARRANSARTTARSRPRARCGSLPLITTRALKFTTDEASWISLDVSPDGKTDRLRHPRRPLYDSNRRRKATRITSGMGWDQQPRYSPDGSQIVFVSDRNGAKNVWIANADGTKPHAVTKADRIGFASPIWSADGQYVFASRTGQLWMYHKDGGSGFAD